MATVHEPYTMCATGVLTDHAGGDSTTTTTGFVVSHFECVPSVRRWWQEYLHSDKDSRRSMGARSHGKPFPTAIQTLCRELLHHTVSVFGSHRGSLSSEALQNIVMRTQPVLYELVVGHVFRFQWHAFLNYHRDTLQLVWTTKDTTGSDGEKCWRVYQCRDRDEWEHADALRSQSLHAQEKEIRESITRLLNECPQRECNVSMVLCHVLPLLDRLWRPCRIVQQTVGHHPDHFESKKTENGALVLCLREQLGAVTMDQDGV
jgi:hypothetical protein